MGQPQHAEPPQLLHPAELPRAIRAIIDKDAWTPANTARVLEYAAFRNDAALLAAVIDAADVAKAALQDAGWQVALLCARNDCAAALAHLVAAFNLLDAADAELRQRILAAALQYGAARTLAFIGASVTAWVGADTPPPILAALLTALPTHAAAVQWALDTLPGLTLARLHAAGVLQRMAELAQWDLLRAALRLQPA